MALLLGVLCIWGLCVYASPMENISLDLSLFTADGAEQSFDTKGWTVYTREGENITELTPDGFGGFTGLELGQTFYFSRVMDEELDSPMLQFPPMESCYSIWLDDTLIYTDCPDQDNRIGYVDLPMYDYYRSDPIVIAMPTDYQSSTLTIAQSFPEWSETGIVKAWPTAVKLYCGYAYESELISETFRTTAFACLCFIIAMVLLVIFVRSRDWSILCMAIVAGLCMAQQLVGASYFAKYFGVHGNSPAAILPDLSVLVLLIYLVLKGGSHRKLLWPLLGLCFLSMAAGVVLLTVYTRLPGENTLFWYADNIFYWLLFVTLVAVMIPAVLYWRKENWFNRIFVPMALIIFVFIMAANIVFDGSRFFDKAANSLRNLQIKYVLVRILPAVILSALITTIAQSVKNELDRRAEQRLMVQRRELTLESYENLRRQHEEVMMIRHDMLRHFHTLHDMDSEQRRTEYLAELIGQNEKIRPVVDSGNEMLDIILNGRLSAAIDAGIRVELPHITVPEKLPLSDPDLCALFLNLVDNAITAASAAENAFLLLKLHQKDGQLAIVCENSFDPHKQEITADKAETVPKHGLGLKIVCNIVEKYKGTILTENSSDQFSVKIVIPMDTA